MPRPPSEREPEADRLTEPSFERHLFPMELEEIFRSRRKPGDGHDGPRDRLRALRSKRSDETSVILDVRRDSLFQRTAKGLLRFLRRIRLLRGSSPPPPTRSPEGRLESHFQGVPPSVNLDLVGLALSGGGIRSATFNLGVIQALAERGIFREVDYLSTVSGGGYLGSCLSSILNRKRPAEFPFATDSRGGDRPALRKLRNSGEYLATGRVDLFRIPALLLRGILVNFAVLLPYLVAAVWLTYLRYGEVLREHASAVPNGGYAVFYNTTLLVGSLFVGWSLLMPAVVRWWRRGERALPKWLGRATEGFRVRNLYERSFAWLLILFVAVAVLELALTGLSVGHHLIHRGGGFEDFQDTWWWGLLSSGVALLFAGKMSAAVEKLRGKIALITLGLLGPLILFWVYLYLGQWGIYGEEPGWAGPLTALMSFVPVLPTEELPASWLGFTLAAAALFAYAARFLDVNATSLHSFYRDRLSRAYLFCLDEVESCVHRDYQPLSELHRGVESPYHLVNATVNLPSSDDPELRGRDADFFLFSKHFIGGPRTGYCSTLAMERINSRVDLGTAMAISGGAAAPHMGTTSIKPLAFLMALLNVRLGYWLQNPRRIHRSPDDPWLVAGAGPWYLVRELLGAIDERSRHVNVSDGGHIENLGVYELLRRRCRYIVACDAEADSEMRFGSLAKLIRYARIDLGVEIDIHLDELRSDEDGHSRRHASLAKIFYPPRNGGEVEVGHLLYVKASVTGEEMESLREYRSRHPDFPHETTADQFFDEAQFESYRELGHHVTAGLFRSHRTYGIEAWFEELDETLRPAFPERAAFVSLQEELSRLEADLARDRALAAYSYQIYSEIDAERARDPRFSRSLDPDSQLARGTGTGHGGGTPHDPERFRRIFHYCNRQLQLMENALLALRLDRAESREHHVNRGWMNLFRRWAEAPYFRATWGIAVSTYSLGFQQFCEEELGLESCLDWSLVPWDRLSPQERKRLKAVGFGEHDFGDDGIGSPDDRGRRLELWMADVQVDSVAGRRAQIFSPGTGVGGPEPERAWFEWFPVGCAVFRRPERSPDGPVELLYYRVRRSYRKMRLFERMLEVPPAPVRDARARGEKLQVVGSPENLKTLARYAYLFERHGFSLPV